MPPEPQYARAFTMPRQQLGPITSQLWLEDPRMVIIRGARYKHTSKLLSGQGRVLVVGCGVGFFSPIVRQEVGQLMTLDFDPAFKPDIVHDITVRPLPFVFDAAFALDVIEHVLPEKQDTFVENVALSLLPHGVFVCGTPNRTSEPWAAEDTKAGHVGWLGQDELRDLLARHFCNVFAFGMNDETLHTGFGPMAHYLLALGVEPR